MKRKGLVLSVEKNTVTVLTPEGEFRRLPRRGTVKVGEEYTYSTTNRLVVAAASVIILIASSPLVASFYRPAPVVEGPGTDPVLEEPIVARNEGQTGAEQDPGKVTPQVPDAGDTGQVEPPAVQDNNNKQPNVTPEKPGQTAADQPGNKPPTKKDNTTPPAVKQQEETPAPSGQTENPPAAAEEPPAQEPANPPAGETPEEVPEAPEIVTAENEPVFQEASRFSPWEWLLNLFTDKQK
ncbi:MAG TPA: anti-sigma factor domain-containing protein [Firmicutes bacterium]|nr:anti-sigma factor domain-containing protein [Bacillota bacterium]